MDDSAECTVVSINAHSWLLWVIVGGHALFNLLFNPVGAPVAGSNAWLMIICIGVVISQPVLFAIWTTLGPGPSIKRVPITILAFGFVVLAECYTGLNLIDKPALSNWRMVEFVSAPVSVFGAAALLMLLVRGFSRWRVVNVLDLRTPDESGGQVSMKFMMGFTTACALFLGVARVLASSASSGTQSGPNLARLLLMIGVILLAMFPTFVVPMLILSQRVTRSVVIATLFIWAGLSLLAIEAMVATIPNDNRVEAIKTIVILQIGAATAGLISTLVARFAGYRFIALAGPNSQTNAE